MYNVLIIISCTTLSYDKAGVLVNRKRKYDSVTQYSLIFFKVSLVE